MATPDPNNRDLTPGRELTSDGNRRRLDILHTARELFLELGYHSTTTRKIAQAADISEALLYRYFLSKRHLFDAVIQDGLDHLQPYLQFGAPRLAGLRLRETLEAAAYTTIEIGRRDKDIIDLMVAESRMLVGDRRIANLLNQLCRSIADRIDIFIAEGLARPCNTNAFALQFIGAIASIDLMHSLFGENSLQGNSEMGIDIHEYLREAVDNAAASLRPEVNPAQDPI